MNQWNVIGRLGRDPEVRFTQGGDAVCNFSIAVDRWGKDKDGEKKAPIWVKVTVWGKQADNAGKFLTKGKRVFISGEADMESYEKKGGGGEVHQLTLRAQQVTYIDYADKDEGGGSGGRRRDDSRGGGAPVDDDDIPF